MKKNSKINQFPRLHFSWSGAGGEVLRKASQLLIVLFLIIAIACTTKPHQPPAEYVCPMHPTIVQQKPGKCPICGMNLVKKRAGAEKKSSLNSTANRNYKFAKNAIKTIQPLTSAKQIILKINGVITPDEKQSETISARYGGRIERLYLKTMYQSVKKGDKLFDIYSPELMSAQREFLYILKADKDNALLVAQAREKLTLWGLSENQVQALISSNKPANSITIYSNVSGYLGKTEDNIKEGDYLQPGQEVFRILSSQSMWADFDLASTEAAEVKIHDSIIIYLNDENKELNGSIDFLQPFQQSEGFTKIRVNLTHVKNKLRPGQFVSATITRQISSTMRVPATAVIDLGDRKVLFVKKNGVIHPVKVEVGTIDEGEVGINSGLQATDSVVLNAGFVMDSDAFIKTEN